jgi:ferredoxin-NADP reductase
VRIDGEEHLRCYSMSSAPSSGSLTVTVKRVPGGVVSNWFNDAVAAGDVLSVTKPAGVFCLRDASTPVVAFCGGSGVTPVMSLARVVLGSTDRQLSMLYANRDRSTVIFSADLESLAAEHSSRFRLQHHIDADAGYLTPPDIAAFVGDAADADFYICGPAPFMDLVEKTLLDLDVPESHIWIERFSTPPSPASEPVTEPSPTESVTLTLSGKRTTVPYQPGDTVLETARRAGLRPPFSCEAGNCATCMALVKDGAATLRANNALTDDELAEGWILTCQALPNTPTLTVDYDA